MPLLLLLFFFIAQFSVLLGKNAGRNWNMISLTGSSYALYHNLKLDSMGLSNEAFNMAIRGFNKLRQEGKFIDKQIVTIIDFSKPSTMKRMFIIDIEQSQVLFNTYVAHGLRSGSLMAERFSNRPSSNQSSLGFYETLSTYCGKHGYSLKLNGLEKGINDKASQRAIVVHGAPYVSEGMIRMQGFLGRSWGCPAVPERLSKPIIDAIRDGSCLFIYAPNKSYLTQSAMVHS